MLSTVSHRLRHGVPDDEICAPFERLALPTYALCGVSAAIGAGLFNAARLQFDSSVRFEAVFAPILFLFAAWLGRRAGHSKIAGSLETLAVCTLIGVSALCFLAADTAFSAPLADGRLAYADEMIGFRWTYLLETFPKDLGGVLVASYRSMGWQPFILFPALFYFGRDLIAWRVLFATAFGLLIVCAVYPLAPVLGPYAHYGIHPPIEFGPYGDAFGPAILAIKGGQRVLSSDMIVGFVSFPSFHAASAAYLAWGAWHVRYLRWPSIVLNCVMAFSALLVGGHYLVDVIAGLALAAATIWLSCRIIVNDLPPSSQA